MSARNPGEGLRAVRLFMVLASISPLFVIWAIRGSSLVADRYFVAACLLMVLVPNVVVLIRIRTARKLQEKVSFTVARAEDSRDHLLVYLFAMLLPLYAADLDTWRALFSGIVAIIFLVLVFYQLSLHYMNVATTALAYQVFTVYTAATGRQSARRVILISKRAYLVGGENITAFRMSDTVFLET